MTFYFMYYNYYMLLNLINSAVFLKQNIGLLIYYTK